MSDPAGYLPRRTVPLRRRRLDWVLLAFFAVNLAGQPLAVPSPAGWTQIGLPRALDGDQVAALPASCDRLTRTGRRDLAILTWLFGRWFAG